VWDDGDGSGDWLTVEDCARRMSVTPERVRQLVRRRALRHTFMYGQLMVEPAVLSGAVT
jgi:hypothetical protein